MSFLEFCQFIFNKYPNIDGNQLLGMCEVAYAEIIEEENGGIQNG